MLRELYQSYPIPTSLALVSPVLLLVWRFWVFTLKPWFRPSDPKALPYWIPSLGHSVGFFKDSDKVIERGMKYTRYSYEPFTLQVLGKKLYIVTSPADVTAVFRDSDAIQFEGYLDVLLKNIGLTAEARKLAWHKPQPGDPSYILNDPINPRHLDVIHFVEEAWRTHLLVEEARDELRDPFLRYAQSFLQEEKHLDDHLAVTATCQEKDCLCCGLSLFPYPDNNRPQSRQVSLHSLCRVPFIEGATLALFGNHLHDIDPKVAHYMAQFNEHAWMVNFGYPSSEWFESPVVKVKKCLGAVLSIFIEAPLENKGQEATIIKNCIHVMQAAGLDADSSALMILLSYWNMISNVGPASFWILSYLLFDESLLELVKKETEAAWQKPSSSSASDLKTGDEEEEEVLNIKYLTANCPHLEAILNEVLRLHNGSGAIRQVLKDTTIGGKTLKDGNMVFVPFHQLHTNKNVWGSENVDRFNPFRFMDDKKNLARHPSFRPWGGGATLCPGSHLAKEEIYGFIAMLFHYYDVRLADVFTTGGGCAGSGSTGDLKKQKQIRQEFPRVNDLVPSIGVNPPMSGMDVIVDLRKKVQTKSK